MIQHIVLLKLKRGTTAAQKAALLEGLVALQQGKITGIESVTGGDNNSPEGKEHGFNWGFVMTFTDAAARNGYLPHSEHKALGQNLLRPIADDVLVLDYEI
ncbi:MAG: Dabb family protein [Candidatus Latescibacterota bacterium]|nr:Dabb family protein [Candidatus Latescibacterota bacterium]